MEIVGMLILALMLLMLLSGIELLIGWKRSGSVSTIAGVAEPAAPIAPTPGAADPETEKPPEESGANFPDYDPETLMEAVHAKPRVKGKVVPNPREAAFALKSVLQKRGYATHVHVCTGPEQGQREMVFVTSNAFDSFVVVFVGASLLRDTERQTHHIS